MKILWFTHHNAIPFPKTKTTAYLEETRGGGEGREGAVGCCSRPLKIKHACYTHIVTSLAHYWLQNRYTPLQYFILRYKIHTFPVGFEAFGAAAGAATADEGGGAV